MAANGVPPLLKLLVLIYLLIMFFLFSVIAARVGVFENIRQYGSTLYFLTAVLWNIFLVAYLRNRQVQDYVDMQLTRFAKRPVTIPLGSTIVAKVTVDLAVLAKIFK